MNILITGKNSYIGEHIQSRLLAFNHTVSIIDTIGDEWKTTDYSVFDAVIHVAAIVHDNAKTASDELFEKVNTQLPFEIAKLAKNSGVKQFIFLSTMAVYGAEKTLKKDQSIVTASSGLNPVSLYGKSKLEAENRLKTLADNNFVVSVVRPPNVYGPGCRGNYINLFGKLAKLMFICPCAYTDVRQSMLYIDNLTECIRLIVEKRCDGVFMPQDDCIPNTVEIITGIRKARGKKTAKSKFFGNCIKLFSKISLVEKIYGGICYDEQLSNCLNNEYRIVSFEQGILQTYQPPQV